MDQAPLHPRHAARVLWGAAGLTMLLGVIAALGGWVLVDAAAGVGALAGVLLVVVVTTGGALLVNAVAGLLPAASLLVALLTYTLQLLLVLLAFLGLERSGLLESSLDRRWVGVGAIGAVLTWLVAQLLLTVRSRIPAFDLPAARHPEGGER